VGDQRGGGRGDQSAAAIDFGAIMVLKAVDSVPFRQVLRAMRPVRSIWLAGPEPWLPEAEAKAARQRALCLDNGFTGLTAPAIVETQADNVEIQARNSTPRGWPSCGRPTPGSST
jgi:hypothetical protein